MRCAARARVAGSASPAPGGTTRSRLCPRLRSRRGRSDGRRHRRPLHRRPSRHQAGPRHPGRRSAIDGYDAGKHFAVTSARSPASPNSPASGRGQPRSAVLRHSRRAAAGHRPRPLPAAALQARGRHPADVPRGAPALGDHRLRRPARPLPLRPARRRAGRHLLPVAAAASRGSAAPSGGGCRPRPASSPACGSSSPSGSTGRRSARELERHLAGCPIDASTLRAVQPIYVARPILVGVADPIRQRTGLEQDIHDAVTLPELPAEEPRAGRGDALARRAGATSAAPARDVAERRLEALCRAHRARRRSAAAIGA